MFKENFANFESDYKHGPVYYITMAWLALGMIAAVAMQYFRLQEKDLGTDHGVCGLRGGERTVFCFRGALVQSAGVVVFYVHSDI